MTYEHDFELDEHGLIIDSGKFEGQPIWVPYFFDFADEGEVLSTLEEGCGEYVSLIKLDNEDKQRFLDLKDDLYIIIIETDDGFASGYTLTTEQEAENLRKEMQEYY
jgi:hypothetical protein